MELGQLGINDTQKVSNSDPQRPHKGQGKQDLPWMPGCLMGSQHLPPKSIALCVSLCNPRAGMLLRNLAMCDLGQC